MNRTTMPREELARRYSRLLVMFQQVAILSPGEAMNGLETYLLNREKGLKLGGCEAVAHYGGPERVLEQALRLRHWSRPRWTRHGLCYWADQLDDEAGLIWQETERWLPPALVVPALYVTAVDHDLAAFCPKGMIYSRLDFVASGQAAYHRPLPLCEADYLRLLLLEMAAQLRAGNDAYATDNALVAALLYANGVTPSPRENLFPEKCRVWATRDIRLSEVDCFTRIGRDRLLVFKGQGGAVLRVDGCGNRFVRFDGLVDSPLENIQMWVQKTWVEEDNGEPDIQA